MNRMPADAPHGWNGSAIDRSRPLRFRLNGRLLHGFAGDTVLTAALANDIVAVGRHGESAVGLDERIAPLLTPAKGRGAGQISLPMARTPAIDGCDFVTLGDRRDPLFSTGVIGRFRQRLVGSDRSLNHRFGGPAPAPPWHGAHAETEVAADMVVVGAGVAGLAAAATAVAAGKHVVLIERAAAPGGAAGFFGATDTGEAPETLIARLVAALEGKGRCTMLLGAEAFSVIGGKVFVHEVFERDGQPDARVIAVAAPHVVLATGAFERLPLFSGNRLPGVTGALAAWQRATRHGIWLGRRALFSTAHSHSYRLAMQAADAGIAVQRVVDTRIHPHSRFIDFCKAMGITLGSGQVPSRAEPLPRNAAGLSARFTVAIDEVTQETAPIETDALIAAGGWQPDLALWMMAGGDARWNDAQQALVAASAVEGIAVAGSAAGYTTTAAVAESGRAASLRLLGKSAPDVVDRPIDSDFETPDGLTAVAPQRPGRFAPAYLDRGSTLLSRQNAAASRHGVSLFVNQQSGLGLGDIAAAATLGLVAPADAGTVAAERCVPGVEMNDSGWRVEVAANVVDGLPPVPAYLVGRFGPRPKICVIGVSNARFFEPGCLIFASSGAGKPSEAIGVIYAAAPGGRSGGLALMGKVPERLDAAIYVHDSGGAVAAQVLERLRS